MSILAFPKAHAGSAGAVIWLVGWLVIFVTDSLSYGSHALLLVLTSALASLVWHPTAVIATSALSVAAFDWLFISPRGRFAVDLREDAVLLLTVLSVTSIIALLLGQLKAIAARAVEHAERVEQMRTFAEALREQTDTASMVALLRTVLDRLFDAGCTVYFTQAELAITAPAASPNDMAALRLCAAERRELGPGTDRYGDFPGWVLPLASGPGSVGHACHGAVLVKAGTGLQETALREHARALLALFVTVHERHQAQEAAVRARAEKQVQMSRNALLASIAHDHRTPLATMLGAASSLAEQHARLSCAQQIDLARTIVLEIEHLTRLTDNTLRLASLDSPHLAIHEDWQSAEELVGTVVQRARRRHPQARFHIAIAAALPLFRADGVLMDQLLDNLVNNAVQYAGEAGPIDISAALVDERIAFEVADRGPGIPAGLVEGVFDPFQRAAHDVPARTAGRGTGLGLAISRAIARVHQGGQLAYIPRPGGGALFRMSLPLPEERFVTIGPDDDGLKNDGLNDD